MIRVLITLLFFFTISSCTLKNEQESLAERSLDFLVQRLDKESGWQKVHAAEKLLGIGYRSGIREQFTRELELYGDIPGTRIGIWRVLAEEAENVAEREGWIKNISRVYADSTQPDRLHAAESLSKLNVNLNEVSPDMVSMDLSSNDLQMKAYVTWGTSLSNDPDSIRFGNLISMLSATEEVFRKTGAYALSFIPGLPDPYRTVVSEKAINEPAESEARLFLLQAACKFPANDSLAAVLLGEVREILHQTTLVGGNPLRTEASMALAEGGTEDDLPLLKELVFEGGPGNDPGRLQDAEGTIHSDADLTDAKIASAYAILRIYQRMGGKVGFPDWLILVAYAFLMIGTGVFYARKTKNAEDYHLGRRSMNPVLVGLSLFATIMSSLSYLSYPGEMIRYGPVIFTGMISFPVVYFIVGWLFIPKFMGLKVTSAYEILEIKIGPGVRIMGTFFFLSLRLLWMATIIYATVEIAMTPIFGIQKSLTPLICLVLAAVTVIYTSMGGLKAVVITDTLQTIILILGALLTVLIISVHLGSFSGIFPAGMPEHWKEITWGLDAGKRMTVGNAILMVFVWYICTAGSDQMAIQRYLATKDVRSARKTFRISIITNFLVQFLLAIVGLALLAHFTRKPYELPAGRTILDYADSVFPRFIVIGLPVGITGLVTAGLISAAMSSLSSGLNSSSSVITEDIIKRFIPAKKGTNYLKQARQISVVIGVVVALLCLMVGYVQGNLLEVGIKVVNLFVAPLFVLFFMALYVPFATQISTVMGGMVSVVTATAIAFFEIFGFKVLWIIPLAFAAGVLTGCILSAIEVLFKNKNPKYRLK